MTKSGTITTNSQKDYEIAIRLHLKPAIGSVPIQRLEPAKIQALYDLWHIEGKSERTVQRCHSILNQALSQAMQWGTVQRNVTSAVSKPRTRKKERHTWTADGVSRFIDVAKDDSRAPLWHLLALEGMRRGEALGLYWRDVNWERGTVHLQRTVVPDRLNKGKAMLLDRTKTNAGARTVRLTEETLAALKSHSKAQLERRIAAESWANEDLVIATSIGTLVHPDNVTRSFERLVLMAGVRRIRVHDMRHTAATLLLLAGENVKAVSERLGHASITITMDLYQHVTADMQESTARAMDDLLARARARA